MPERAFGQHAGRAAKARLVEKLAQGRLTGKLHAVVADQPNAQGVQADATRFDEMPRQQCVHLGLGDAHRLVEPVRPGDVEQLLLGPGAVGRGCGRKRGSHRLGQHPHPGADQPPGREGHDTERHEADQAARAPLHGGSPYLMTGFAG